jgi:hypothetical protein
MRGDELAGEAAVLYEEWRAWGCTEAEAIDLVERSGLLGGNPHERQVYEATRSFFRASPRVASAAALGDQAPARDLAKRKSQGAPWWAEGRSVGLQVAGRCAVNDHDRVARNLRRIFNLTESQAEAAARGRGSDPRPVSEAASVSSLKPDPANVRHVVAAIEELASDFRRRGVAEDKALRDAAFEVMRRMPDERSTDWVVRVASRFWPSIYASWRVVERACVNITGPGW